MTKFKSYRKNRRAHYTFLKELCIDLLQLGVEARRAKPPPPVRKPLSKRVGTACLEDHQIVKADKQRECVACQSAVRSAKKAKERERKPLQALSTNSVVGPDGDKEAERERQGS